jgi:cytochrome P450
VNNDGADRPTQILGADNEMHAELRKIFNPAFSEKSLRSWEPMFKKVTTQMKNRLLRFYEEESKPIDMCQFFMYATFDIMGEFTLDQSLGMVERMEFLDWIAGQYRNMKITAFMASASYLILLRPPVAGFAWLMLEQRSAPFKFAVEQGS